MVIQGFMIIIYCNLVATLRKGYTKMCQNGIVCLKIFRGKVNIGSSVWRGNNKLCLV